MVRKHNNKQPKQCHDKRNTHIITNIISGVAANVSFNVVGSIMKLTVKG